MNFDQMGWSEAVDYVRTVGMIMQLLLLSVPVGAFLAIRRGRRNQANVFFPRLVLWLWVALLVGTIFYFFTGAWYGENGPPPQVMAAKVTVSLAVTLVVVVAIQFGLYMSTRAKA